MKYTSESREREKFSFLTFTMNMWRYGGRRSVCVKSINVRFSSPSCWDVCVTYTCYNLSVVRRQQQKGKITLISMCIYRLWLYTLYIDKLVNNVDEGKCQKFQYHKQVLYWKSMLYCFDIASYTTLFLTLHSFL